MFKYFKIYVSSVVLFFIANTAAHALCDFEKVLIGSSLNSFQNKFNLDNSSTAMFEDLHVNLREPSALGWQTVWVTNNIEYNLNKDVNLREDIQKIMNEKNYISHVTDNLENFLNNLE